MSSRPLQTALPVAAPPRVAAWIAAQPAGPVRVLHAGPDAVHLDVAGRAVTLAAAGAAHLPQTLRTNLPGLSSGGAETAYLGCGILYWGGRALVTARLVDVRAPRLDAARIPQTGPAAALGTPRPRGAGLVALAARVDAATVPDLIGRGDGLTPLGDDVICGWLALHRAVGVPTVAVDEAVRACLHRTTTLSATLLDCALAGEVADLLGAYLRSLGTPGEGVARAALEALGHSSGRGLAHGVDLARADLVARTAA